MAIGFIPTGTTRSCPIRPREVCLAWWCVDRLCTLYCLADPKLRDRQGSATHRRKPCRWHCPTRLRVRRVRESTGRLGNREPSRHRTVPRVGLLRCRVFRGRYLAMYCGQPVRLHPVLRHDHLSVRRRLWRMRAACLIAGLPPNKGLQLTTDSWASLNAVEFWRRHFCGTALTVSAVCCS